MASALVPYEAAELNNAIMAAGASMAPDVWKDTKWAARKIGRGLSRAWRNKRQPAKRLKRTRHNTVKSARTNVGEPIGTSNSRRFASATSTSTESDASRSDRLLNWELIAHPSGWGGIPNQRERNIIRLGGFKLCMEFTAGQSLLIGGANRDRQVTINVCVLSQKFDPTDTTLDNTHFFRANDGVNRAIDFDVVARSIDFHCLPVNTDKFNIHMHHRTYLSGESIEHGPTVRRIMKYIPINRQIRYDDSNKPSTQFFLVWWAALAGEHTTLSFSDIYKVQWTNVTYYRDP